MPETAKARLGSRAFLSSILGQWAILRQGLLRVDGGFVWLEQQIPFGNDKQKGKD